MLLHFHKYHGTGNDFILLDNRENQLPSLSVLQVHRLCDRHYGIGADGLMLLQEKEGFDFEMIYYNADGNPGSLCGNGSRCMIRFAEALGIRSESYHFLAADGPHRAELQQNGMIAVKMNDVSEIRKFNSDFVLDTGSPHYVKLVTGVVNYDVVNKGREIRKNKEFIREGINVNFTEKTDEPDKIIVRTYERGVENETLSCGTGVTAAALVCFHNDYGYNEVEVTTPGGKLSVEFERTKNGKFENIWLSGPAEKVFEGTIELF